MMKLQIGDPAPAGLVIDIEGRPTAVEQLWADGPIFLTFLRHFG
jgi:hypothetical protein